MEVAMRQRAGFSAAASAGMCAAGAVAPYFDEVLVLNGM